jgi:hypothetical protein
MVSLVVVQLAGRYMATLTVLPIAGTNPPPIVVIGEGPTVARATGAAEALAWKALRVADNPHGECDHEWTRRDVGLETAEDPNGRHDWRVCEKCGRVEVAPAAKGSRQVGLPGVEE